MLKQALAAYAAETKRVFADRSASLGGSDIGQCARKVFWLKNEDDPDYGAARDRDYIEGYGATLRGTLIEEHFVEPALRRAFGSKLLYAGAEQETLASEYLSATPDGLVVDQPTNALAYLGAPDLGPGRSFVVEIKSIDPRATLDEPKSEHVFQCQTQMGLFRELTEHQPEYGVILYINASFLDDAVEYLIRFDQTLYDHAKQRAAQIMTVRNAFSLRPEGWITGGKECGYCPFTGACGRQRMDVPYAEIAPVDPQFTAEIADLAQSIKQFEAEEEAATTRLRSAQEDLKERLRSKKLRRVVGDGVSVLWSAVKGRPSYDHPGIREAAANAGVDLRQYETVGDPTDRLTIRLATSKRTNAS
jgi:hypothetical protein